MKGLGQDDLQQATENALNLANVFDSDVNEVARAGQNLMKGFGITSEKAFDLNGMGWAKRIKLLTRDV
jgi:phage-related minor tail protein